MLQRKATVTKQYQIGNSLGVEGSLRVNMLAFIVATLCIDVAGYIHNVANNEPVSMFIMHIQMAALSIRETLAMIHLNSEKTS